MSSHLPKTIPLLVAAAMLVSASTAAAAPAGEEYLPGVPKAEGGSGSPSSEVRADSTSGGSSAEEPTPTTTRKEQKKPDSTKSSEAPDFAAAAAGSDDDSEGSGFLDTLLDPVVLLLILGVGITAVGMTLRRRQPESGGEGPKRSGRDPANAPHTPDGEIVSGSEQTSS